MTETDSGPDDDESYCIHCGEPIASTADHCPECGEAQTLDTSETGDDDTDGTDDGTGFTSWAIGFEPGETPRNVAVAFAYFFFYFVGIPLLIYAYWRRGGKYKKRTYAIVGVLLISFVGLAAIGALVGPVEDTGSTEEAAPSTPTPEPVPEFSVRVEYTGSWEGALSVTGGGSSQTESISGSGTQTIEVDDNVDILSANAQKQDDGTGTLTVQILHEGEVVSEASTSSAYGVAQTSQSF